MARTNIPVFGGSQESNGGWLRYNATIFGDRILLRTGLDFANELTFEIKSTTVCLEVADELFDDLR